LELKPFFEYVCDTLPFVTWHRPDEELLVLGYLPVTWTCPMDFYQWADNFMGLVFTMGAHLRRYIAEDDPEHAAAMLDNIIAMVQIARRQADPEDAEYVKRGGDRRSEGIKVSSTRPSPKSASERNSISGTLRRLARSRPDLLARVESGELSAYAAAVEAGIRKRMVKIPVDTPDAAIKAGLRYFTLAEMKQALAALVADGVIDAR